MKRGRAPLLALAAAAVVAAALALTTPGTTGGFVATVVDSTDTAGTAPYFTCSGAQVADASSSGSFVWALNESTGATTATDSTGHGLTGSYSPSATSASAGHGCLRDTGGVFVPSTSGGTTGGAYVYSTALANLASGATMSLEVWFKSTSQTNGGELIGMGNGTTSTSTSGIDRILYLNSSGNIVFGIRNSSGTGTITSPAGVNYSDGAWHDVIVVVSSAAATMYVDGASVTTTAGGTQAVKSSSLAARTGLYWRVGYDNVTQTFTTGTNNYLAGAVRFAAYYNNTVLTSTQVQNHYVAGN